MAIPVKCPNPSCGKQLSLKDELAGKTVKCEACGRTFEVPAPEVSPDAPTTPVTPGAPAARLVRKAEPADALVGAKIAHYRIQAILGEGGMGKV